MCDLNGVHRLNTCVFLDRCSLTESEDDNRDDAPCRSMGRNSGQSQCKGCCETTGVNKPLHHQHSPRMAVQLVIALG